MAKLVDKGRERDETLTRVAAPQIRIRCYTGVQLVPRALDVLAETLRRG